MEVLWVIIKSARCNEYHLFNKHNNIGVYADFWYMENAMNVFQPLLGILTLIQAIENWGENKKVAMLSLFAAIFIFITSILLFVI